MRLRRFAAAPSCMLTTRACILQLGKILARIGDHDGAIASFQQARTSSLPSVKLEALYHSGLSFEANNAYKLADRNYREALKLLEPEDKAMFLALHYRLGRTAESLGNNEAAEEHYNEVAADRLLVSRRRRAAETLDLTRAEDGMLKPRSCRCELTRGAIGR